MHHAVKLQAPDQALEQRAQAAEFGTVGRGERGEDCLAMRGDADSHLALVVLALKPFDQIEPSEAIDQFGGAMRTQQQSRGQFAHQHFGARRGADGEQRLMLLRGQPRRARRTFAEMQELSQLEAKVCEHFEVVIHRPVISHVNPIARKNQACYNSGHDIPANHNSRVRVLMAKAPSAGVSFVHPPRLAYHKADRRMLLLATMAIVVGAGAAAAAWLLLHLIAIVVNLAWFG